MNKPKGYQSRTFNEQIGRAKLKESFIYTVEMLLEESTTMKEGKDRVMFQIMQDMIVEEGSYTLAKNRVEKMLKKLKTLS